LGDLVALGEVRVEIIFAGEARMLVDGAVQGEGGAHGHFDSALVQDGKGPGQAEADGTDVGVRWIAETRGTSAENLGARESWTWTSKPMTGSYFASTSGARDGSSGVDFAITERRL